MKQVSYWIIDSNRYVIGVSASLVGAKIIATRGGCCEVFERDITTGAVKLSARKNKKGRWDDITF